MAEDGNGAKPAAGGDVVGEALGEQQSKPSGSSGRDVRRMVEDIIVTPFFKHHGSHMPATIKLHAELREEKGFILFESSIPGFEEDEVKVEVNVNSINVSLLMDKREKGDEEDVFFHNSFTTPSPVDSEKAVIEHKDGVLRIKVPVKSRG